MQSTQEDRNNNHRVIAQSPLKNALAERLRGSNATATVKLVAGMAGGLAEACLLQPLDVAKTRLQLDKEKKYKGMFDCLRKVVKEEGVKSLYKGLTPFVTHLTLKYALRFGLFEKIRVLLNGGKTTASSNGQNFIAGMAVGCIEATMIVTPFEVVKTRLQKQKGNKNLKYSGPIDVVIKVSREEGIRRLWSGNIPTVIRQGSNQAFNFMSMQILNEVLWGKKQGDGRTLEVWKTLLNGLLAGAVGPCFNAPVDVIKTRMMAQTYVPGEPVKYKNWFQAGTLIAQEEGVRALWKGIIPRLTRLAPGQAITWACVMRVTAWFEEAGIGIEETKKNATKQ
jgi:solute carrier family 25 citrate transporter 1